MFFLSFILFIFIFLLYISQSYSFINDTFYLTTRLNNGNFLIFGEKGKYTLDSTFNL